jgi:uncharacterized membrane protein
VRSLLTVAAVLELLAITIWVGGMAALSFLAAPAIFQTAPSRESAGRSFGLILRRFHWVAYGCGAAILLAGAMRWGGGYSLTAPEQARALLAAVMLGIALYSGVIVSGRLDRLRAEMSGGVDSIPKQDPRRVRFNQLHRLSTALMGFNLLLGLMLTTMFAIEH